MGTSESLCRPYNRDSGDINLKLEIGSLESKSPRSVRPGADV
jgi:hypothetical protein